MNTKLRSIPIWGSLLMGSYIAYIGWRYIVFFSGGSGFSVPIPNSVVFLFLGGITVVITSVISLFRIRKAQICLISLLVVFALFFLHQLATHEDPSTVLLIRGTWILISSGLAIVIYRFPYIRISKKSGEPTR